MKRFLDSSTSQPEAFTCHTGSPIPNGTTSLDITPRPGNVDYSIHINGVENPGPALDAANQVNVPRMRQGLRNAPAQG